MDALLDDRGTVATRDAGAKAAATRPPGRVR
jgi:hypothetical protein